MDSRARRPRQARPLLLALLLTLPALSGCTWDSGEATEVRVILSTDQGRNPLQDLTAVIEAGWTVLDALQAVAVVETRYGGGFVHAIDGHASRWPAEQVDWFYEVDGIQEGQGAASRHLEGGETVHWDLRGWQQPGSPPGLWNSFPWLDAGHFWDLDLEGDEITPLPHDWPQRWPEGAVVAHVAPDNAPWAEITGATRDGERLVVGETPLTPPWSLAVRVGPVGTARAVVIHAGHSPDPPQAGYGIAENATLRIPVVA